MSNIIMLLLPIVVTPILSRLYLPSDFGDWGVFSSFVSIYTLALFAGYENALVKVTEEEISYTATLCIVISLLITIATTLAFLFQLHRTDKNFLKTFLLLDYYSFI